jgi:hypothetical protein
MTGFYEHGKEHLVFIKSVNFLTDDKKELFEKYWTMELLNWLFVQLVRYLIC